MDKLFPYQLKGASFLAANRHALLAHEMGLGKSVMAIRGLESIRAKKALIICPSVARINWLREFEKWSETKWKMRVLTTLKCAPLEHESAICSFDYAVSNYEKLKAHLWDCVVVDECHFLKSHEAKRSKAILGSQGIIRSSQRVWLMSGTPAPNHPGELWTMLYTFGVTHLKYDDFVDRYCKVRETSYGLKISGANRQNIPELKQLLSKIMLRETKDSVGLELPKLTITHTVVEPGLVDFEILPSFTHYFLPADRRAELASELKRQEDTLKTVFNNVEGDKDKFPVLAGLASSVSTLRRYVGLQKVEPSIEIVKSAMKYGGIKKLVIFAIHADVIEGLRAGLREFKPVVLYGRTDPETRQKNIDRFQKNPKCQIFIANILAAGTAITLTAAHHVFFVEQDWVPGNNAQAIMRCHRIGQEKPVFVKFLLLDNSLDSHIGFILKNKTKDLTQIFNE